MLDILLCGLLLLALPLRALATRRSPRPLVARLRSSVAIIGGLLVLLTTALAVRGDGPAAIGLGMPDTPGLLLLALSLSGVTALAWVVIHQPPAADAMVPATRLERRWYALFALLAGFGWEALYRGYLLLVLSPVTAMPAAVALGAVAYALCHGPAGWRSFAASLATALAFTFAYWWSATLWWLVSLHIGLALLPLLARAPVTRA